MDSCFGAQIPQKFENFRGKNLALEKIRGIWGKKTLAWEKFRGFLGEKSLASEKFFWPPQSENPISLTVHQNDKMYVFYIAIVLPKISLSNMLVCGL